MANALFDIYKEALLGGGNHGGTLVNLDTTDVIKVALIDTGTYAINETVDEDIADLSPDPRIGTDQTLGNTTVLNGTFNADDPTFTSVNGNSVEELLIYKDTGVAATSILLVSFESATGLPVTPNGGDIVVQFNAAGIFAL